MLTTRLSQGMAARKSAIIPARFSSSSAQLVTMTTSRSLVLAAAGSTGRYTGVSRRGARGDGATKGPWAQEKTS